MLSKFHANPTEFPQEIVNVPVWSITWFDNHCNCTTHMSKKLFKLCIGELCVWVWFGEKTRQTNCVYWHLVYHSTKILKELPAPVLSQVTLVRGLVGHVQGRSIWHRKHENRWYQKSIVTVGVCACAMVRWTFKNPKVANNCLEEYALICVKPQIPLGPAPLGPILCWFASALSGVGHSCPHEHFSWIPMM